jgi:LmbE family N-acetylglucosaminyl deacetylase
VQLWLAVHSVDKAIANSPSDPENLQAKAEILAWSARFNESEQSYLAALKLDPQSLDIYQGLGDTYKWEQKYSLAIEAYRRALKLDPRDTRVLLKLARVYKDAGMRHEAEETVNKAFQIQPDIAEGFEILRELEQGAGYGALIHDYAEPAFIIGFLGVIAVYFRNRREVLNRRHPYYKLFLAKILPSVILIWLVAIGTPRHWGAMDFQLIKEVVEIVTFGVLIAAFTALSYVSRARRASEDGQRKVVLAIGAHPDDIELGCGATLAKFKDMGYAVHGMVMTSGEKGNAHINKSVNRKAEAKKGASILGLDSIEVFDFKDTALSTQMNEIKSKIEETIKKVDAQVIITQSPHDVHQDHRAVFEATKIAARGARSILCFEDVSTEPDFSANYFVDVTEYVDDKIKAVKTHQTQNGKYYMHPDGIRGRAAHRGLQAGVPYAEAFLMYRGLNV